MSLTLIIIIITVAASFYAWEKPDLYAQWTMYPYGVNHHKEYWRFLTAGFIHADFNHLLFNMISFYFAGQGIESAYKQLLGDTNGELFYIGLYLIGIIAANVPGYLKHKDDSYYPGSIGASGGVSAVMFALILFIPTEQVRVFFIVPMPAIVFAVLYLWSSQYMAKRGIFAGIDHQAHFWGAVFGIVYTIAIYPEVISNYFLPSLMTWF
jgi:membrane associated rhomboid family serine protease